MSEGLLTMFGLVMLAVSGVSSQPPSHSWVVESGTGTFYVTWPSEASAAPETLSKAQLAARDRLPFGARIRRSNANSYLVLVACAGSTNDDCIKIEQRVDAATPEVVTYRTRAVDAGTRAKIADAQVYMRRAYVRRSGAGGGILWPSDSSAVWPSEVVVVLASPASGAGLLVAENTSGSGGSLRAPIDLGGDVVESDSLRAWLGRVQRATSRVRVRLTLRFDGGTYVTSFQVASTAEEREGQPLPPGTDGGHLLDRGLRLLRATQLGPAYRDVKRSAGQIQAPTVSFLADSIRVWMANP